MFFFVFLLMTLVLQTLCFGLKPLMCDVILYIFGDQLCIIGYTLANICYIAGYIYICIYIYIYIMSVVVTVVMVVIISRFCLVFVGLCLVFLGFV